MFRWFVLVGFSVTGLGHASAQEGGSAQTLPVTIRLEGPIAKVDFRLLAPGHLLVLDITDPKHVDVLFPEDRPILLPAGSHELQFDRPPRVLSVGAGFPAPNYGPCTELRALPGGDGVVASWTGACGMTPSSAMAASRATAGSGVGSVALQGTPSTFLIVVQADSLDKRAVHRLVAGVRRAGNRAELEGALLNALPSRGTGVRWATVTVHSE
jgi:hypothetical protein